MAFEQSDGVWVRRGHLREGAEHMGEETMETIVSHMHACTHACIHVHVHARINTCTHAHAHKQWEVNSQYLPLVFEVFQLAPAIAENDFP